MLSNNIKHFSGPLHTLQTLRFIAAAFVVVFHSYKNIPNVTYAFPYVESLSRVGAVGVHLFFVISGFIMIYASRNMFELSTSTKKFLIMRIIRIFPMFWIFNAIYIFFYNTKYTLLDDVDISSIFLSFLLVPGYSSLFIGPAWTLSFELYFYIIFSAFLFLKIEKSITLISLLFFLSIAIGTFFTEKSTFLHLVTNTLLLEFVFGMITGYLFIKNVQIPKVICIISLIVGCLVLLVGASNFAYERVPTLIVWGIPCGLIVFGAVMLEKSTPVRFLKKYSWLGDSSYTLYLVHVLVIRFIFSFDYIKISASNTYGEIAVIIVTFISIFSSVYIFNFIEKPLQIFLKKIFRRSFP